MPHSKNPNLPEDSEHHAVGMIPVPEVKEPEYLYRGDRFGPEKRFAEGFTAPGTNEDLAIHFNGPPGSENHSAYIATTREPAVSFIFPTGRRDHFIYLINPQKTGINVPDALLFEPYASRINWEDYELLRHEKEIAVPREILPPEIKGVWEYHAKERTQFMRPHFGTNIPYFPFQYNEAYLRLGKQFLETQSYTPNPHYKPPIEVQVGKWFPMAARGLTAVGVLFDAKYLYDAHRQGFLILASQQVAGGWAGAYLLGIPAAQVSAQACIPGGPLVAIGCGFIGGAAGSFLGYQGGSRLLPEILSIPSAHAAQPQDLTAKNKGTPMPTQKNTIMQQADDLSFAEQLAYDINKRLTNSRAFSQSPYLVGNIKPSFASGAPEATDSAFIIETIQKTYQGKVNPRKLNHLMAFQQTLLNVPRNALTSKDAHVLDTMLESTQQQMEQVARTSADKSHVAQMRQLYTAHHNKHRKETTLKKIFEQDKDKRPLIKKVLTSESDFTEPSETEIQRVTSQARLGDSPIDRNLAYLLASSDEMRATIAWLYDREQQELLLHSYERRQSDYASMQHSLSQIAHYAQSTHNNFLYYSARTTDTLLSGFSAIDKVSALATGLTPATWTAVGSAALSMAGTFFSFVSLASAIFGEEEESNGLGQALQEVTTTILNAISAVEKNIRYEIESGNRHQDARLDGIERYLEAMLKESLSNYQRLSTDIKQGNIKLHQTIINSVISIKSDISHLQAVIHHGQSVQYLQSLEQAISRTAAYQDGMISTQITETEYANLMVEFFRWATVANKELNGQRYWPNESDTLNPHADARIKTAVLKHIVHSPEKIAHFMGFLSRLVKEHSQNPQVLQWPELMNPSIFDLAVRQYFETYRLRPDILFDPQLANIDVMKREAYHILSFILFLQTDMSVYLTFAEIHKKMVEKILMHMASEITNAFISKAELLFQIAEEVPHVGEKEAGRWHANLNLPMLLHFLKETSVSIPPVLTLWRALAKNAPGLPTLNLSYTLLDQELTPLVDVAREIYPWGLDHPMRSDSSYPATIYATASYYRKPDPAKIALEHQRIKEQGLKGTVLFRMASSNTVVYAIRANVTALPEQEPQFTGVVWGYFHDDRTPWMIPDWDPNFKSQVKIWNPSQFMMARVEKPLVINTNFSAEFLRSIHQKLSNELIRRGFAITQLGIPDSLKQIFLDQYIETLSELTNQIITSSSAIEAELVQLDLAYLSLSALLTAAGVPDAHLKSALQPLLNREKIVLALKAHLQKITIQTSSIISEWLGNYTKKYDVINSLLEKMQAKNIPLQSVIVTQFNRTKNAFSDFELLHKSTNPPTENDSAKVTSEDELDDLEAYYDALSPDDNACDDDSAKLSCADNEEIFYEASDTELKSECETLALRSHHEPEIQKAVDLCTRIFGTPPEVSGRPLASKEKLCEDISRDEGTSSSQSLVTRLFQRFCTNVTQNMPAVPIDTITNSVTGAKLR